MAEFQYVPFVKPPGLVTKKRERERVFSFLAQCGNSEWLKMAAIGLVWLAVSWWLLLLAAGAGNMDIRVVETPVRRKSPGKG